MQLGAAGAHVTLGGRTRDAMDEAARAIEKSGGSARVVALDVRDVAAVQALVEGAAAETGRLDIMVNNAGVSFPGKIADADPEQWRAMLETNVLALLVGSQAAIRAMRACKAEGHIVNISSIAAQRRDSGVYGATKHAVNCISATLRDGARGRHDPRRQRDARRDRDQLRAQLRPRVRRRLREGDRRRHPR